MINFNDYFSLPPESFLCLAFTPYSESPLRKLLNILDKCWETELTTLIQKILHNFELIQRF